MKVGRPVSASILPNGCVIEFFDNVVLYQDNKSSVIENTPSITVRSFVNSYRYKNIVSATKEDECTFHSVETFDIIGTSPIYKRFYSEPKLTELPDLPSIPFEDIVTYEGDFPF